VNAGATTADANPKSGRSGERGRGGRKKYVLHLDKFQSSSVFLSVTHQPYSCFRAKVPTEQPVPVPLPLPPIDLELPVDPNEPTYCLCNQVSYGEMVACDNPNVCDMPFVYSSFDKFHFSCPCFGCISLSYPFGSAKSSGITMAVWASRSNPRESGIAQTASDSRRSEKASDMQSTGCCASVSLLVNCVADVG
jgi:hypothetical protein